MSTIRGRKRTIGIAALVVIGMFAGFVVATSAAGEEFATVGTIADDNRAYTLPLEEDQQVRFTLEAAEDAQNPEARFAIYDAEDRFFGFFDLAGDGDDVEIVADRPGEWVVFVTHAMDADLAVQFEEDGDENASAEDVMDEIEVTDHERTVAHQDEGALDEELALRLDQRPAVAFLEYEGNIENLDATVRSEEGIVHEIVDGSANTTENGTVSRSGQTALTPSNLDDGTYKIQATADSFSGSLDFVHQTYDRGLNATDATEEVEDPFEDASIVAHAEEHEAYAIPMQGAGQLMLAVQDHTHARVLVYNGSDDVTDIVELEGDRSYDWDHDEDDDSQQAPFETKTINVTGETPVVFVQYIHGHDDAVFVALPGVASADPVETPLELEETKVVFEHDSNSSETKQANLTGGLVGLSIHSEEIISMERSVTVTGPLGEIAHVDQRASTFGWSWYHDHNVEEEHFSDGLMEILFEQDGPTLSQGETVVKLHSYIR